MGKKQKRGKKREAVREAMVGDGWRCARTPWAEPRQPRGSGGDQRWKGRREEENNAPVPADQLLHRTGLNNQVRVQTREANRPSDHDLGWGLGQWERARGQKMKEQNQKGSEGRGKGVGGRPAAKDTGQRTRWWTNTIRGKGAGQGRGAGGGFGGGNPVLRESAPGSGACDWPRLAMVTGATTTEVH